MAAVEPDLVQHRHGDGVGIGEALLRYRRIAAVHVIDGDVGRCGQRVVDDALVAVGELQVVVGGGEVGAQPHLQPGLQLRIQVHAHSQTVELAADDRSLLVHVVGRDVVLHLLRTALCGNLVRVLEGGLEDGVLPVRALPQQRRVGIVLVGRGGIDLSRGHEVVVVVGELPQVHDVQAACLPAPGHHAVVGELRLAGLSPAGGDEDDAVRTLCAVDGGGGGVLQDFHRNDVAGVDGRQRRDGRHLSVAQRVAQSVRRAACAAALHDDAVDDVERLGVGVDGGLAADTDARRRAGSTRRAGRRDTRRASLQRLVERGDDGAAQLLLVHGDGRTGDIALLHRTVAHDDDFIEGDVVFRKPDGIGGLGGDLHLLGDIADVRHLDHAARRDGQREVAVEVGDGGVVRTFLLDSGADDGLLAVGDLSGDLPDLLGDGLHDTSAGRLYFRRIPEQRQCQASCQ